MKKTFTTLRALGCEKKHLLAAIVLCTLIGNAYGEDKPYRMENDGEKMVVFGDCKLSDIATWAHEESPLDQISIIEVSSIDQQIQTLTVTVDDFAQLPASGMLQFLGNCSLQFDSLSTIQGSVPMIYVGDWYNKISANLTLNFTENAIKNALDGHEVSEKVELKLLNESMFMRETTSTVSFLFGSAGEGDIYTYTDGEVKQEYTNVGIISPVDLDRNTAALLFEQGTWNPEQAFATGSFTVAFVGSNYDPAVPEPATGTLGLLALAGLCARRRRK